MPVNEVNAPWFLRGCAVALLLVGVAWLVSELDFGHGRGRPPYCKDQLHMIFALLRHPGTEEEQAAWPPHTGKNFALYLVACKSLDLRRFENLKILFLNGVIPEDITVDSYRDISKATLTARRFPHLTHVAGPAGLLGAHRPSDNRPMLGLALADGAVIADASGSVRYVDRDELGLGCEDPIQFGPASKSPVLRQLSDE